MNRATDPGPELHAVWGAATGYRVPYTLQTGYRWELWQEAVRRGLAASDWPQTTPVELLRAVVRYRRAKARDNPRVLSAWVSLRKITQYPEECLEDFAYDHAERRNRPTGIETTDKARVLRATGRRLSPPAPAPKSAEQILRESALLAQLKASTQ